MMLSCKEVSELVSQAQDRRLSFTKRMRVRVHLLMCRYCTRYEQQLRFIRRAARRLSQRESRLDQETALSPEARERIREALKRRLD